MKAVLPSCVNSLGCAFLVALSFSAHAAGGPGTALHFIDAFDSVSVPHTNALNAYPFTVTAWFQWQSVPGPDPTDLIRKHDGAFNGWRIQIVNDRLYASYFASGSSYVWDGGFGLDGGFVADPLWHHLAFTVDASGGKLYVDGGLMASLAWTGTPAAPTTTQNLFMCGSDPPGARDFRLDEVTVWNVALSQTQIQTNKNRSLTGNEAGLLAYYWCDEGSGTTLTDSAPAAGNNNGTLLGALFANSGIRPFTPFAQTLAATAIGATNATLNGAANPVGTNTSAWFEWGATTNYGSVTPAQSVGSGTSNTNFSQVLTGLGGTTTYHFRAVASNSLGMAFGTNQSFMIPLFNLAVTDLPGLNLGTAAWGDYDKDGRLDLLLVGTDTNGAVLSDVWRNKTSGFDQIFAGLTGVTGDNWPGAAAWGDFDRNGWLDIALAGSLDGTFINNTTEVWANHQGGFSRINLFSPALPNLVSGTLEWGDYDNDGRLDLLLAGYEYLTNATHCDLWRNSGTNFALVDAGLPPFQYGTTDWGDYDNDGDLDLLLAGENPPGTQLLRQTGGAFTNVAPEVAPGLPNLGAASVAWGDYDNDGRLDFLTAGLDGGNLVSQLWRNTGSTFTNVPIAGLRGIAFGSLAWGDCDNDGRLDFLITGRTNVFADAAIAEVWRNTGSGFTNFLANLPGVSQGTAAWGDYNNDGRLDIALMGTTTNGGRISQVYQNQLSVISNSPPSAPTGLSMNYTNGTAVLSWTAATDTATPAAGLSSNVRMGTAPGLADLISPQAATNGFRRLPAMGNAQMRNYSLVSGLSQGQVVYWSVQAVDTSFAGGLFSTEMSWTVGPLVETLPAVILGATTVSLSAVVNPDVTNAWFEWGTSTNLGIATPVQLISSSGFTNINQVLNGLTVGTTYYFRAVGSNNLGVVHGAIRSFALVGFTSIQSMTNGLVEMNLGGLNGAAYLIEASTNLTDWKLTACLYASNSPVYFVDPETAWFDKRFYRFGTFPASLQSLFQFVDNHTNFFSVLFRHPSFSGSTAAFIDTSPGPLNFAVVTKSFPGGVSATNVLHVAWAFTNGAVNPWVRLSTSNADAFGNPTLDFSHGLCFDFYTDRDLYLALGLRETDTSAPIGANGGTIGPIEWVGGTVNNAVSPPLGRLITAGQWHQVCFFPPAEPVKAFTGNGILTSTTGRGVFEHLAIVPVSGTGVFNIYFGDFQTFTPTAP